MSVTIKGMATLERRLRALSDNARGELLRKAVLEGAEIIRDEAERLAPKRTGRGAAGIKTTAKASGSRATAEIGYDKKEAWHLRFAELGTKHHSAQPHLRPAIDTKKGEAVQAVGLSLKLGIDRARRA